MLCVLHDRPLGAPWALGGGCRRPRLLGRGVMADDTKKVKRRGLMLLVGFTRNVKAEVSLCYRGVDVANRGHVGVNPCPLTAVYQLPAFGVARSFGYVKASGGPTNVHLPAGATVGAPSSHAPINGPADDGTAALG